MFVEFVSLKVLMPCRALEAFRRTRDIRQRLVDILTS